jgi:hypothetical protein
MEVIRGRLDSDARGTAAARRLGLNLAPAVREIILQLLRFLRHDLRCDGSPVDRGGDHRSTGADRGHVVILVVVRSRHLRVNPRHLSLLAVLGQRQTNSSCAGTN